MGGKEFSGNGRTFIGLIFCLTSSRLTRTGCIGWRTSSNHAHSLRSLITYLPGLHKKRLLDVNEFNQASSAPVSELIFVCISHRIFLGFCAWERPRVPRGVLCVSLLCVCQRCACVFVSLCCVYLRVEYVFYLRVKATWSWCTRIERLVMFDSKFLKLEKV